MATDQHSTSRRAVIGALAAAPIFTAAGINEATARAGPLMYESGILHLPAARWRRALANYRRLDAEWMAHPYASTKPSAPGYERLRVEQEILGRRAWRALRLVMRTAAPDHAAFVEKMEVVDLEFGDFMDGQFVHLVNDARRLGRLS